MFKYNTSIEKQKIFISGLPFSCTKKQLEDVCSSYGTIKDVRLVTYRSGKPKVSRERRRPRLSRCRSHWVTQLKFQSSVDLQGLAYVEFAEETHASQAVLKMDGMVIDDNKISVAISNPPRRNMDKPGSGRPLDPIPRQVYGV